MEKTPEGATSGERGPGLAVTRAACTQREPGILRVQWVEGNGAGGVTLTGGHFVVCIGRSQDQWIYHDSEHGVVTVPAAPPFYLRGERMGLFTHLLQVTWFSSYLVDQKQSSAFGLVPYLSPKLVTITV